MLRAIFVIFFFQLLGEALKKFFEMRIPGPVIGLILLLITLIFLKRFKTTAVNKLKSDVLSTSNYILSYLSLLFVPIGVGVVMHLSYLENNLFKVLVIVFIQLLGEALKKFFEMRIPGPVIGLILLLITLIFLKRFKTTAINKLKSDVLSTSNYILSYLSLLFVPIGVGVVMHLSYLENNLFKVLVIVFISTILTIGLTAFLMEKINKRINKK
jgi:holin-like protein